MHRLRLKYHGDPGEVAARKGNGGTGHVSATTGYRYFYRPLHPNAGKNGQVAEHTMVMAELIGRPLRQGELVHHKNGRKDDVRPGNLELWVEAHPTGQRVKDLLVFARWVLANYSKIGKKLK
jgi:hypothetical protein